MALEGSATGSPEDGRTLDVFIDECGTWVTGDRIQSDSRLFICVAVVVDGQKTESVAGAVDGIARRLRNGAELKSSRIGGNHRAREALLKEIQGVDFQYCALVVDKTRVDGRSGLRFQQSFQKYFKRLLQEQLAAFAGEAVRISFDEYGSTEFMSQFETYMGDMGPLSLFPIYEQRHVRSEESRLVQLADLIAGTLSQIYEPDKRGEHSSVFMDLLRGKQLSLDAWPFMERPVFDSANLGQFDEAIAKNAVSRAERLIADGTKSADEVDVLRAEVLDHLLFARVMEESSRQSMYADELVRLLSNRGHDISKRVLREIIGSLRDRGVVVAGSSSGYKLAMSEADIAEYLVHTDGIIGPMMHRLRVARRTASLDTGGRLDILAEVWPDMRMMLDSIVEGRVAEASRPPSS